MTVLLEYINHLLQFVISVEILLLHIPYHACWHYMLNAVNSVTRHAYPLASHHNASLDNA